MDQSPRRKPGRPVSDAPVVTRVQILEKALEAFGLHGFEATSLRALSRDLGGSHGLVHHHFGSKDALWTAAIDHALGQIKDRTEHLSDATRPEASTKTYLRDTLADVIAITIEYPMLARIALDEGARGGPRLDYLYDNYYGPIDKIWRDAVSRAGMVSRTSFVDEARMIFFMTVVGGSAPYFAPALADKFEGAPLAENSRAESYAQSMADLIFDGLSLSSDQ